MITAVIKYRLKAPPPQLKDVHAFKCGGTVCTAMMTSLAVILKISVSCRRKIKVAAMGKTLVWIVTPSVSGTPKLSIFKVHLKSDHKKLSGETWAEQLVLSLSDTTSCEFLQIHWIKRAVNTKIYAREWKASRFLSCRSEKGGVDRKTVINLIRHIIFREKFQMTEQIQLLTLCNLVAF